MGPIRALTTRCRQRVKLRVLAWQSKRDPEVRAWIATTKRNPPRDVPPVPATLQELLAEYTDTA